MSSYTAAELDTKAFQFRNGTLVLPLQYDYSMDKKEFEGFVVFDMSNPQEEGIKELFRVNHVRSTENCHYCDGYLSDFRSFLYDDGRLVTMYKNLVVATDTASGTELWALNMTVEGEEKCCDGEIR